MLSAYSPSANSEAASSESASARSRDDVVVADRLADRYNSLQQSCREGVVADFHLGLGSTDKYVGEAAVIAEPVEQRFRLRQQLSRPIELAQYESAKGRSGKCIRTVFLRRSR